MGLLCQVHIHSQQGSNCNRDSLLASQWEPGGRPWIYSPSPGRRRVPAYTACTYQIFPCCFLHRFFLPAVLLLMVLLPVLFLASPFLLPRFLIFLSLCLFFSTEIQLCQEPVINTSSVFLQSVL